MRSSLEEHVLGAAQADALGAELARRARRRRRVGVGADLERADLVGPVHQRRRSRRTARAATVGTSPSMTSPVVPSSVMTSPAFTRRAARRVSVPARRRRSRTSPAPATQGLPMPRATTAAWLVMPPRAVRMPSAACMPWMSSGVVSMRTRITFSPAARQLLGLVGGEHDLARRGARRGRQALGDHLARRLGIERRVQQLVERGRARRAGPPRSRRSAPRSPCRRRS